MAIYMKFGSVDGGVTTEGFKNWIELNSAINNPNLHPRIFDFLEFITTPDAAYIVGSGNGNLQPVSQMQQEAVLARDWQAMIELGGSIFYVYKLAMMDGRSMQYLGGVFTGMGEADFLAAMRAGGRRDG